eukprot:14237867-Alexandrium_andersonii.AAC.1
MMLLLAQLGAPVGTYEDHLKEAGAKGAKEETPEAWKAQAITAAVLQLVSRAQAAGAGQGSGAAPSGNDGKRAAEPAEQLPAKRPVL